MILTNYEVDHIVPRTKGGPDAAVNFILTTRQANKEKDNRTPYEWLASTNGWDAYVNRVRSCITTLRHKKAQLLISPDAEKLVEKYTALAETAWISKLAQTILCLRYGWKNGNDNDGQKRVIVVSGGLTGRIRRKYGINRILNPNAVSEEEADKKNRDDDRHHALDAMVISYLPVWARDQKKTGFFKFPSKDTPMMLAKEIESVMPNYICFEKPALAETIYGRRNSVQGKIIVQRAELIKLAQKQVAQGKTKYDLEYALKQIQSIRDCYIKDRIKEKLLSNPSENQWNEFCSLFSLTQKNGSPGSKVLNVTVDVGEDTEYKDLSKDKTGAFRKASKGHKGQMVYRNKSGKPTVRPVYIFESIKKVRDELEKEMEKTQLLDFSNHTVWWKLQTW